jgi:hypothetical protein
MITWTSHDTSNVLFAEFDCEFPEFVFACEVVFPGIDLLLLTDDTYDWLIIIAWHQKFTTGSSHA